MEVDRDHLRQKQRIETAAEEWQVRGKLNHDLWQGKLLTEAKTFQQKHKETLALSTTAEEFIGKGLRWRQNRLKSAVLGLIAPVGVAVFIGFQVVENARLVPYKQVVREHSPEQPQKKAALVEALEILNQANQPLGVFELGKADLSSANLSSADLSDANLSNVKNWTKEQLSSARLCQTKLPVGADLNPNRDCKALGIPED